MLSWNVNKLSRFFHLLQDTVIYFDVNLYNGCPFPKNLKSIFFQKLVKLHCLANIFSKFYWDTR